MGIDDLPEWVFARSLRCGVLHIVSQCFSLIVFGLSGLSGLSGRLIPAQGLFPCSGLSLSLYHFMKERKKNHVKV